MECVYNLTLKRNKSSDPIIRAAEVNGAKKVIKDTG